MAEKIVRARVNIWLKGNCVSDRVGQIGFTSAGTHGGWEGSQLGQVLGWNGELNCGPGYDGSPGSHTVSGCVSGVWCTGSADC